MTDILDKEKARVLITMIEELGEHRFVQLWKNAITDEDISSIIQHYAGTPFPSNKYPIEKSVEEYWELHSRIYKKELLTTIN